MNNLLEGIPDVLYHGTTLLRWNSIRKAGRIIAGHSEGLKGYSSIAGCVYLTSGIKEAERHCLWRYALDMNSKRYRRYYMVNPGLRDPVVITISTSGIMENLQLDPEDTGEGILFIHSGHKGDIGLEHVIEYEIMYNHPAVDLVESIYSNNDLWLGGQREELWGIFMSKIYDIKSLYLNDVT